MSREHEDYDDEPEQREPDWDSIREDREERKRERDDDEHVDETPFL